jgi:hypothetical protein
MGPEWNFSSPRRRIAIEIDRVLAGTPASRSTLEAGTESWEEVGELEPRTVSRLASIASSRRWEIIFLTRHSRRGRTTGQIEAQRWLESFGFALPCVYVASGPRSRIASALHLDLVIDASADSCVDVVTGSHARAILVWPHDQSTPPVGAQRADIHVVTSFSECLDMLTAADDPGPKREGLLPWLRRLFGSPAA